MPHDIPAHPELLIVSDTAMWKLDNGIIAFEPVVREIENFGDLFSKISWIGYQYPNSNIVRNARAVKGVNVDFLMLPRVGGESIADKLQIFWKVPSYFFTVWNHIRKAQVVHTRGPSLPAFFAILLSLFDRKRIYWHKYAGNWEATNAPFFYRLQKKLLQIAGRTLVTVNGSWPDQPPHIANFENPCLTASELEAAHRVGVEKKFEHPYTLCFVGNLDKNKGITQLIAALKLLKGKHFGEILIAGDGPEKSRLVEEVKGMKIEVKLLGFQSREQLDGIYGRSHFIILPSASEGFPKVISEAMAFGCIPIVTDVSCISQYIIEGKTGYLLEDNSAGSITNKISMMFAAHEPFKSISVRAMQMSKKFTYSEYNKNIKEKILHEH